MGEKQLGAWQLENWSGAIVIDDQDNSFVRCFTVVGFGDGNELFFEVTNAAKTRMVIIKDDWNLTQITYAAMCTFVVHGTAANVPLLSAGVDSNFPTRLVFDSINQHNFIYDVKHADSMFVDIHGLDILDLSLVGSNAALTQVYNQVKQFLSLFSNGQTVVKIGGQSVNLGNSDISSVVFSAGTFNS